MWPQPRTAAMAPPTTLSSPRSRRVGNSSRGSAVKDSPKTLLEPTQRELSPPLPLRSPLRPQLTPSPRLSPLPSNPHPPPQPISFTPLNTTMPTVDSATIVDPAVDLSPFNFDNPSYSSIDGLLEALTNSRDDDDRLDKSAMNRSDSPLALSPVDDETGSSTSSLINDVPDSAPAISKRTHALLELLSSERAYASDLALIRDIHIPLALGQPAPFQHVPAMPTVSSGSSSRTVSSSSDSSTSSATSPPMSREDTRIIFSNVPELALFADMFTEHLEEALGSVLEGGQGEDRVGKLFLDIIPALEPPYKLYITRHPSALAHLNSLPQTEALTAYLAYTRTLASSLTHAWDLPSLLIKPVQRLLKYPLLLAAIIDETPDSHGDKENLQLAKKKLEAVARGVNEGRRRWEVVKEVLTAKPGEVPKKKGLNVGVAASVNLGRMKSLRSVKAKEGNEEAAQVELMEKHLKTTDAFVNSLAKAAIAWAASVRISVERIRDWAISFGKVIGLSEEQQSEAFDAFLEVLQKQLMPLCTDLENTLKDKLLRELARLIATSTSPMRLLDAMNTLEPMHYGLLNINFAKNRPPTALLEASQSYLALRGQLCAELPQYLSLLDKGIMCTVHHLAQIQAQFYADVRDRWSDLWDALRVEGEMNAGATETLRVWWDRWGEVDKTVLGLKIVYPPKRTLAEALAAGHVRGSSLESPSNKGTVVSMLSSLEPQPLRVSAPMSLSPSSSSSQQQPQQRNRSRGGGNESATRNSPMRRYSNESLHSGKSSRSSKSRRHSRPDDYGEYIVSGSTAGPTSIRMRNMSGGLSLATSAPSSSLQSSGFGVAPSFRYEAHESAVGDLDQDRGRISRKPSLRRKLTDTLLPAVSHRRRSSSVKSMDSAILARERGEIYPTGPTPLPSSGGHRSGRLNWEQATAKYSCRVVHPCYPPLGVSYSNFPFFQLEVGEVFEVLKEAGHPCTHENLPLYVDDGEDCLLLVRDRGGQVGWALASFLIPED